MSKRTLKTGTVRKAYALYWEPRFGTQYHEKCLAEFDRWLERVEQAAYKRGVADGKAKWQAEALREAVVDMRRAWEGSWNLRDPRDPEVFYSVDVWLDRRADRIEKGSDDGR